MTYVSIHAPAGYQRCDQAVVGRAGEIERDLCAGGRMVDPHSGPGKSRLKGCGVLADIVQEAGKPRCRGDPERSAISLRKVGDTIEVGHQRLPVRLVIGLVRVGVEDDGDAPRLEPVQQTCLKSCRGATALDAAGRLRRSRAAFGHLRR